MRRSAAKSNSPSAFVAATVRLRVGTERWERGVGG